MGSLFGSPAIIPVIGILGWVTVTWIRAHYGMPSPLSIKHGWRNNPENMAVPPMFQKLLEKAMAERDAEIQSLRERVEVLEKIVTDGHKSNSLADEIERLRDSK
jgi:hypothetical protein